MLTTISEMITTLKGRPDVFGLIEYGTDHRPDNYTLGDCDLFWIVSHTLSPVESLHFRIGPTPVDLNLMTLEAISHLDDPTGFHQIALLDGRVIYDPMGEVTAALERLRLRSHSSSATLSEHTIAVTRHGHRHIFDKIKGRLGSGPLFCGFLLETNVYWLVQSYFRVRRLAYKGEKHAIQYLEHYEPEIIATLNAFYETADLAEKVALARVITDLVLEPVGGMWQDGELLAFGDEQSQALQAQGLRLFQSLFSAAERSRP